MSILQGQDNTYCYEIDEFDNYAVYPIDCALVVYPPLRVATLPPQEWIDYALSEYWIFLRLNANQAAWEALNINDNEYYSLYPEKDPGSQESAVEQAQYVLDNQPTDIQAFVDFIRFIELGI
ncbi:MULTISPECIES: hypothetical protein [unclassified Nostoc]|uniref:hypothetical protein n=1 Tax=unclassified Nostoc TaxID=2593658 RepID=UPI002AD50688|nr:hypothetical protein [Nostoc sp. DedQUE03]MDZ7975541.1 hypothetical protein [Nostoc sp. DedQUE03]MDZ8045595.1 hypothetical protein [Nostoc sp. DedQUE02]